jgi:hypothetical protein
MIGYLVFDALVGNTDRHHQNWGVLIELRPRLDQQTPSVAFQLAPTFDHGSSLGRELTDEARQRHLKEGTVGRYISKATGGIFEHAQAKHGMSPIALAILLAQRYPDFFRPWQTRVRNLKEEDMVNLVECVTGERMSEPSRAFTLALLSTSRQLIEKAL